jgi:predicted extracellular nuclease
VHRFGAVLATTIAATTIALGVQLTMPIHAGAATPTVKIKMIRYNPAGIDVPATNTRLNGEYLVLENVSRTPRTLTGWTLRDSYGHTYRFPTTTLGAGKTLVLRTGSGTNSSTARYWQRDEYVWNNSGGDTATLRNKAGTLVHRCAYTAAVVGTKIGQATCR